MNAWKKLLIASGLSNTADGMGYALIPLIAVGMGANAQQLGLLVGATRLPWLLFPVFFGVLIDRVPRQRALTWGAMARCAILFATAVLLWRGQLSLWSFGGLLFCLTTVEVFFDCTAQTILPEIVEREDLTSANGALHSVESITDKFVGTPIAGFLSSASLAGSVVIQAFLCGLSAVFLSSIKLKKEEEIGEAEARNFKRDLRDAYRFVTGHRLILGLASLTAYANLFGAAFSAIFVLHVIERMGASQAIFGIFLSITAAGSIASSLVTGRIVKCWGQRSTLVLGATAFASVPYLLLFFPTYVGTAISALVVGFSTVTWNILAISIRQELTPNKMLGRVNSFYRLLAWGVMPVGAILGGAFANAFGLESLYGLSCVMLLVFPICAIFCFGWWTPLVVRNDDGI